MLARLELGVPVKLKAHVAAHVRLSRDCVGGRFLMPSNLRSALLRRRPQLKRDRARVVSTGVGAAPRRIVVASSTNNDVEPGRTTPRSSSQE